MGIRGPRGLDDALLLWRRRQGFLPLWQWCRSAHEKQLRRPSCVGRGRALQRRLRLHFAGGKFLTERVWALRHARQRLAMVGGLLASELPRSSVGWLGVDNRRLRKPCP